MIQPVARQPTGLVVPGWLRTRHGGKGGASVFNRLIGWFGQKMRQASLLIRNREPQSLQLWYTSHFPPALGFLSALMISSFLFLLYWITRSLNKGFIDPTQQRGQL